MNARRTRTSLQTPDLWTQSVNVSCFMVGWLVREHVLNLQAMGIPVARDRRPRHESTIPDRGPMPVHRQLAG